jgi:hypothetical protein
MQESTMLAELMADMLDYSNDSRYPRVTGIRNLQRVDSNQHSQGYSFTFEALVNGEWLNYGPHCHGNFTVRSDQPPERLPCHDPLWSKEDTATIPIGWWQIDRYYQLCQKDE